VWAAVRAMVMQAYADGWKSGQGIMRVDDRPRGAAWHAASGTGPPPIPTLERNRRGGIPNMATRSKSSQRWLKEHFSDPYVKKALAEGMRSRAAYKLEELVARDRLLKPGMVVVDLGAAPGGWSQWLRQELDRLDPARPGRVLAVDIL